MVVESGFGCMQLEKCPKLPIPDWIHDRIYAIKASFYDEN